MALCDLHIHSTFSDGIFSPEQIIDFSREKGLAAISITDHDEIKAIPLAKTYAGAHDIQVISGVELSALYQDIEIHILGYLFDEEKMYFNEKLGEMRLYREMRAEKMVEKLEEHGCAITFNDVKKFAGKGAIGRPHIAQAMLEGGCILEYKEAFTRYIGNGKPCNEPKLRLHPSEAIELITGAGGIPVLAHPGNIGDEVLVRELLKFPFRGIEIWHPDHSSSQIALYLKFAGEKKLLMTGGSDSHGKGRTKTPIGGIEVDAAVVDVLIKHKEAHL